MRNQRGELLRHALVLRDRESQSSVPPVYLCPDKNGGSLEENRRYHSNFVHAAPPSFRFNYHDVTPLTPPRINLKGECLGSVAITVAPSGRLTAGLVARRSTVVTIPRTGWWM